MKFSTLATIHELLEKKANAAERMFEFCYGRYKELENARDNDLPLPANEKEILDDYKRSRLELDRLEDALRDFERADFR